jgi:hypothetical protein
MSELVVRLRRRAHLPEFKICGEAADALEAAEQERDAANRRYEQIWKAWERELQESPMATRMIGLRAAANS